jgi:6-pyruvoyl-tetrahydropterin synthase
LRAEIEKSYEINCTHQLPEYPPCRDVHKHKYEVIINVLAWINEDTGRVIDFKDLDEIIEKYNDKNLNDLLKKPTVENFALKIGDDVITKLEHYSRVTVTVKEAENSKVVVSR